MHAVNGDLSLPLPQNEDELLAEFYRLRSEYNMLSRKDPSQRVRRNALERRYRELDAHYGVLIATLEESVSPVGTMTAPTPRAPLPMSAYVDTPVDAALDTVDPFDSDANDSLFVSDNEERDISLMAELLTVEDAIGVSEAPLPVDVGVVSGLPRRRVNRAQGLRLRPRMSASPFRHSGRRRLRH